MRTRASSGAIEMITLNLVFFLLTFILTIAGSVVRWVAPRHVLGMAMLWARMMGACAHTIGGIRVEVTGLVLERVPKGAALMAARYQSAFDTFTLLPRCCYVMKS